ncbi:MAG: AbrB/MazE/SpoVT family DNA-binding domain-containing protein [Methanobacteriota archaeon]|nr:AbrB/MazE/SpoVT family DNA-binding domain-containing protein [Candidatus Hydrothermarchaeota archaeon]
MEFVRMSKKGQIVVPKSLREKLGLSPQDKFIAYGKKDYVIFKKVELPSLRKEFEEIAEIATTMARERGITEKDIEEEIRKYREEKRAK